MWGSLVHPWVCRWGQIRQERVSTSWSAEVLHDAQQEAAQIRETSSRTSMSSRPWSMASVRMTEPLALLRRGRLCRKRHKPHRKALSRTARICGHSLGT